jgi:hypothetical protein
MRPYLAKYASQQVLTGQQAEAYADHFIAVHPSEMPYRGVYPTISAAAPRLPSQRQAASPKQTAFHRTTLRGLLLEAYAFGTFATIAFWPAIAAFILAALMAVLVALGFWHARRTAADALFLVGQPRKTAPRAA